MTSLDHHETVEWLLEKCAAEGRNKPFPQYTLISLRGPESGGPPPEAILEAFESAKKQAFDTSPGGWVCGEVLQQGGDPGYLKVAITPAGLAALDKRRAALQEAADATGDAFPSRP